MPAPRRLEEYRTVKAAAAFLGVCPSTLRNGDRAGTRMPGRYPMNRDRLDRRDEWEAVLRFVREERQGNG